MYSYITAIVLFVTLTAASALAMAKTSQPTTRNVASIYMSIHGGK